jgi:pimeloyl-ACP methyl ester carboxylesterase
MNDTPHSLRLPEPGPPRGVASLPWPPRWISSGGLHLAVYDTGQPAVGVPAARAGQDVPLLVVHSVNAAASAFEWEPFVLRQARRRRVVALDLPGFGLSDRPDRPYTPMQMAQAIGAAIDWIDAPEIDIAALSLGCEFATEAVLARPAGVRSLALVSPTGMEGRRVGEKFDDGATRESAWLRRLLRGAGGGRIGRWVFQALRQRWVMHGFLARSWGTADYDKRLLAHALRCAGQPGARHAPLDFVAGALFTIGIIERYRALPVPVWVAHGRRGAFTDFGACPDRSGTAAAGNTFRLQREVFDGGSMPHFELADAFDAAYLRFLAGLAPSAFRWRAARPAGESTPRASVHEL